MRAAHRDQTFVLSSATSLNGATTTASVVVGQVCFQEAAKLISTADIEVQSRPAAWAIGR